MFATIDQKIGYRRLIKYTQFLKIYVFFSIKWYYQILYHKFVKLKKMGIQYKYQKKYKTQNIIIGLENMYISVLVI